MIERVVNRDPIVLRGCSCKCPFFHRGYGLGHDSDWSSCQKEERFIHEYRNDYDGPFPEFCTLPPK